MKLAGNSIYVAIATTALLCALFLRAWPNAQSQTQDPVKWQYDVYVCRNDPQKNRDSVERATQISRFLNKKYADWEYVGVVGENPLGEYVDNFNVFYYTNSHVTYTVWRKPIEE